MIRLALALLGFVALHAHAQQDISGSTPSGAYWRIAVPAGWQPGGPLVLYQHGFTFSEPEPNPGLGVLRDVMLSQGYAVAATSYRQRGWAVFTAVEDTRELVEIFRERIGEPGEVIPWGGSLGGLVALRIAESSGFPPIHGVYAACPAAAGSRLWDHAIDLRLAYDVVCAGAGNLPTGAEPTPWAFNLGDIPTDLDDFEDQLSLLPTLLPLNQCTGVNLPDSLRTDDKRRRLAELMAVAGTTDEDFFITQFAYATYAMSDLVRAPDKLAGRNPFTTAGVAYPQPAIEAGIARISADPFAAQQLREASDVRGATGAAKVMSMHTSRDELVVPANQDVLRQRIPAGRLVSAIVAEAEPSHCGFSLAEGLAGWMVLRDWMHTDGPAPAVADLQASCESLVAQGADGDCRFDANAVVPPLDSVYPVRPSTGAIDARYSGQWYDPSRSGEGISLEVLPDGRALVYFFTYPPEGVTGTQAWMIGSGPIDGNAIAIPDMRRPQMRFDPTTFTEVLDQPLWGGLWITFDDCGSGRMRWEGPAGWGSREVVLRRLTALDGLACDDLGEAPAQPSGAWSDRRFNGNGFLIERLDDTRTATLWFSPGSATGGQTWMTGVLEGELTTGVTAQTLYRPSGPRFGDAFDPTQFQSVPAMQLDLRLGCGTAGAGQYTTTPVLPGSGTPLDLNRITRPAGVADCTD